MDKNPVPNLQSLVEEKVTTFGERLAVLYDTGDTKEYVTYTELWDISTKVKNTLARYSVEEEVVGLCLQQDKHIPAVLFGVLCAGAAFYNFEPDSTDFVLQVIQDIHVRILVIDIKFLHMLQDLIFQLDGQLYPFSIPECPHLLFIELHGVDRKCHHSNLAYSITTSGTTGRPKVVQVPHCCIVLNIIHIRDIYSLTSDDLVLLSSPLTFDPCIVELFTSLSVGACVLIVPSTVKASPESLLQMIYHRNAVTVIQCTPALLRRFDPAMVRETILGNNSSLRVLSLGGEKFPSFSELNRLRTSGNQTRFYNLYGITEVSSWAMCYEVIDYRPGSEVHLGFPLLGTEVKVCGDHGERLEEGTGRIYIGGKERQCIIGSEEEKAYNTTMTKWRDTGDFGKITKDGCISYIGREDTQIKRHGKRLNLEEINQIVGELPLIAWCTTQLIDNKLVVFIVIDLSTSQLDSADDIGGNTKIETDSDGVEDIVDNTHKDTNTGMGINKAVTNRVRWKLPSHYLPDYVLEIQNVPLTKHGKLDEKELSLMYKKSQFAKCHDVKPLECLCRAWKTILCIDCETISDSSLFLDHGGDSFKAIKLLDTLELELQCKLPKLLDLIMKRPFRALINYLETEVREAQAVGLEQSAEISVENSEENKNKLVLTSDIDIASTSFKMNETYNIRIQKPLETDNTRFDNHVIRNKTHISDINSVYFNNQTIGNSFSSQNIVPSDHTNNGKLSTCNAGFTLTNAVTANSAEESDPSEMLQISNTSKGFSKRLMNLTNEDPTCKKVKSSTNKQQLFYKFIQRGNKIYRISEAGNGKDEKPIESCISADTNAVHKDISNTDDITSNKTSGDEDIDDKKVDTDNSSRSRKRPCDCKHFQMVELKERWNYKTGKCVDASPLLAVSRNGKEDVVFIGSHSHQFSAVSMATGKGIWEVILGDRIESSACMSRCGNYVIVGCYDGNVYVIDSRSGKISWRYQTGAEVKSSPTVDVATGLVYIGSHSQCLYALNIQERCCVWQCHLRCGSIFSSPLLSYDPHRVYCGTLGGYLVSIKALTGKEVWKYSFGKPVFSSPCLSDRGVIVGCVDSCLYHISHAGRLIWKYKTNGPIFSSPAIYNNFRDVVHSKNELKDHIEFIKTDVDLHCTSSSLLCNSQDSNYLPQSVGENKDSFPGDRQSISRESLCEINNAVIIFGCHGNRVYCLTGKGKLLWQIDTESPVYSTPFIGRVHAKDTCHDQDKLKVTPNFNAETTFNSDSSADWIVHNHTNRDTNRNNELYKTVNTSDNDVVNVNIEEHHENRRGKRHRMCTEVPDTGDSWKTTFDRYNKKECPALDKVVEMVPNPETETQVNPYLRNTQCTGNEFQVFSSRCYTVSELCTNCIFKTKALDIVTFVSTKGTLYLARVQDGEILHTFQVDGEVFSSPVLYRNSLIIGCRNDSVYCFEINLK